MKLTNVFLINTLKLRLFNFCPKYESIKKNSYSFEKNIFIDIPDSEDIFFTGESKFGKKTLYFIQKQWLEDKSVLMMDAGQHVCCKYLPLTKVGHPAFFEAPVGWFSKSL